MRGVAWSPRMRDEEGRALIFRRFREGIEEQAIEFLRVEAIDRRGGVLWDMDIAHELCMTVGRFRWLMYITIASGLAELDNQVTTAMKSSPMRVGYLYRDAALLR